MAYDDPAVVFDLGNVLIRWDPHPAVAAGVGAEEAGRFLAAEDFDFLAWNHLLDAGARWADAAARAGMDVIRFTGDVELRPQLRSRGLPV